MTINTPFKLLLFALCLCVSLCVKAQSQNPLVQIIHNSPDTILDTIDIYFNAGDGLLIDSNLPFRSDWVLEPPYVVPGSPVNIIISRKHSYGTPDSVLGFSLDSFQSNHRYVLFLSGVINPAQYAPNPDGRSTALNLTMLQNIDSIASSDSVVFFKFFQGATDLDTVQGKDRLSRTQLFTSTTYDSLPDTVYTALDSLHHQLWEFQLLSPDSSKNYGTYQVDFTFQGGNSVVLFTSGFLNPQQNDSGAALGLFGAFLNGDIIQFPTQNAAFQLIHNSPDTALDSVDVYINGVLTDTSFAFRTATTASPVFAYATYDIGIAQKHSTSVTDTFWSTSLTFQPDTFYIATVQGELSSSSGYAPNPQGISTGFNMLLTSPAEYTASSGFNFDFFMVNGIPDAGPLYLLPQGGPVLCDSVVYNSETGYVSLPAQPGQFYVLNLASSASGGTTYGNYFANFPAYQGQSGVLLASGFLNPSNNNNGPSAGLYLAPIAGGPFVPLFPYTSINETPANTAVSIFPNPANNTFFVQASEGISNLKLLDVSGQVISDHNFSSGEEQEKIALDASALSPGLYTLQLTTPNQTGNYKLVVAR